MTKSPPRPPKEQRNYRIDKRVAEEFDGHCDRHDLIRDRTVERALRLFLDTAAKNNTQTFVVELSDDAAASLYAYRRLFMADRNELMESALLQFIDRRLDLEVEQKETFERLKSEVQARASN